MAFGRGNASFTIDALKLSKDSLPATVTEPPPVFPELLNAPHPLIESPLQDCDYKLNLKLNFNSSFRTLHDPTKSDHEKNFSLNRWKEEWSMLPRELRLASRMNTKPSNVKPNVSKANVSTTKKKKTTFNIDLNTFSENQQEDEDDDEDNQEQKNDENLDVNENDDGTEAKSKDKKKLTDNENEIDADVENEEEDMDEFEAIDYTSSYFDAGDGDDDDFDDDGGDGGD